MFHENEWEMINPKKDKKQFTKMNKERVTLRLVPKSKKYCLRVSIGLNIANVMGFKKDQEISIYRNVQHKNYICIRPEENGRYRLSGTTRGSFLVTSYIVDEPNGMKLSHTVKAKYYNNAGFMIIELNALY